MGSGLPAIHFILNIDALMYANSFADITVAVRTQPAFIEHLLSAQYYTFYVLIFTTPWSRKCFYHHSHSAGEETETRRLHHLAKSYNE